MLKLELEIVCQPLQGYTEAEALHSQSEFIEVLLCIVKEEPAAYGLWNRRPSRCSQAHVKATASFSICANLCSVGVSALHM